MRVPPSPSISLLPFSKDEFSSYGWGGFRLDLFAALGVALTTIPQSIAYSLLAGLPPTAGLFAAIFGTIFTAALGSSRYLVSGPTTGVAILIQTTISDVLYDYFGAVEGIAREALVLHILGQIVLIMGLIQIGAAFFNASKILQFVSRPVILGYFAGIMSAIIVSQLFYLLGIPSPAGEFSVLLRGAALVWNIWRVQWMTLFVGAGTLLVLLLLKRKSRPWPDALIVLILASLVGYGLELWMGQPVVATLRDLGVSETPLPHLTLPILDFKLINKVFPGACAIAFLAILEVYSVSRNFAAKCGQTVRVNQDIFGLGCGNLALSFLIGAMPGSGSATRTSLNYRLHARTRLAAIFSSLLIGAIIVFCWPLVQHIPLTALAALLIATVPVLIDWQELKLVMRATREDLWVFCLTFGSCLIFSLDIAFFLGIVLSIGTYLRRSSIPQLVEYAFNSKGRLMTISPKDDVHRKVRIIGIGGDLYFATADVFQSALSSVAQDPNVQAIVLRLNNVHHMDASMCLAIQQLHESLTATHRYLVISGLTEEVWHVFHRAGIVKRLGLDNLYFTDESNPQFSTWKACLHAQEMIHRIKNPHTN